MTIFSTPVPAPIPTAAAAEPAAQASMESMLDLAMSGGPLMIPIAACSVVALAFSVERWLRLRPAYLGTAHFGRSVVAAVQDTGVGSAIELCETKRYPLARILRAGLRRAKDPFLAREKAVEDMAAGEVKRLSANLRPLLLVWLIAPLLGLLGTVWGMIEAFSEIAMDQGIGRPELLAAGIYQALATTAAGLAVAIPAVVAHHYLKGRIEAFARRSEDLYRELDEAMSGSVA